MISNRRREGSLSASAASFFRDLGNYIRRIATEEYKIHLLVFFIIMFIAVTTRILFLSQPMRYDEAHTFLHYASKPLSSALSNYSTPNNHLFHTFLVHITCLIGGNQPWLVRLPAFLAGILLVPASYLVIRRFYNKGAALLTASLVASSGMLIFYSTNARGYTLVALFFLLTLALANYLRQKSNSFVWLLWAILSALGFYTIPIMIFPFGVVSTWLLISLLLEKNIPQRRILVKQFFIFVGLVALLVFTLYSPIIMTSGLKPIISNQFIKAPAYSQFWAELPSYLKKTWNFLNTGIPRPLRLLLTIGFFLSLIFHKRLTNQHMPVIIAVITFCIPLLVFKRVIRLPRIWLFLLPLYLGLASAGISLFSHPRQFRVIQRYKSIIFALLAITISFSLSFNLTQQRYFKISKTGEAHQTASLLKDLLKSEEDRVLSLCPINSPIQYYSHLKGIPEAYFIRYFPKQGINSINRLFIAVKKGRQTLKEVLKKGRVPTNYYNKPKLVKKIKSINLYEMSKANRDTF